MMADDGSIFLYVRCARCRDLPADAPPDDLCDKCVDAEFEALLEVLPSVALRAIAGKR